MTVGKQAQGRASAALIRAAAPTPPAISSAEGNLDSWRSLPLSEICDLTTEQIQPAEALSVRYVGLEHLDSGDPTLTRWGSSQDVRSAKTRFRGGDVLYGKLRPYLDKAVAVPFVGICSTDILVLRPRSGIVSPNFLAAALHTKEFVDHAVSTSSGVHHPRTSWGALKDHPLLVPEICEQRAIAKTLQAVLRAKAACEQAIAATRKLKESLLHHLFTYGPVPPHDAAQVQVEKSEEGVFPRHWQRASLGDLCRTRDGAIQTGPFGSQLHKADYVDDGIPVLNPTHLLGNRINHEDVPRITNSKAVELARHRLRSGDILFARRGQIGRHGFVGRHEHGWLCGTGCFLVRVNHPDIANAYLPWYLSRRHVVVWLEAHAAGAIMPNLNSTTLAHLPIWFPSLRDQLEISEHLQMIERKLATEGARRAALENLFKSLLHHLMMGKIRVNHVVDQLVSEGSG